MTKEEIQDCCYSFLRVKVLQISHKEHNKSFWKRWKELKVKRNTPAQISSARWNLCSCVSLDDICEAGERPRTHTRCFVTDVCVTAQVCVDSYCICISQISGSGWLVLCLLVLASLQHQREYFITANYKHTHTHVLVFLSFWGPSLLAVSHTPHHHGNPGRLHGNSPDFNHRASFFLSVQESWNWTLRDSGPGPDPGPHPQPQVWTLNWLRWHEEWCDSSLSCQAAVNTVDVWKLSQGGKTESETSQQVRF